MRKSYTELLQIPDYIDRFNYLKIGGKIGIETFGSDRYLNQVFYTSSEWRRFRNTIIARDKACDMAFDGFEVSGQKLIIHHLNPITAEDVLNRSSVLFDPENVVVVADGTHRAIHYGDESLLPHLTPIMRAPNDMCPWR